MTGRQGDEWTEWIMIFHQKKWIVAKRFFLIPTAWLLLLSWKRRKDVLDFYLNRNLIETRVDWLRSWLLISIQQLNGTWSKNSKQRCESFWKLIIPFVLMITFIFSLTRMYSEISSNLSFCVSRLLLCDFCPEDCEINPNCLVYISCYSWGTKSFGILYPPDSM